MKRKTANLIRRICSEALKPPVELTVSQWAEKYRILDNTSAFPGRWNNSITPYLVGIMDEYCNPYTRKIIFVKPTQVGGTEALLNIIGWSLTQDPGTMILVLPSDELGKAAAENRIQPMVDRCPGLSQLYIARKSRKLEKHFNGATLYIRSAGSGKKLASIAAPKIMLDESDKFPKADKDEKASPFKLIEERTKTFPLTKKIYDNCTPTLQNGHIWTEKENADVERHYVVPCPHCQVEIELRFQNIMWPNRKNKLTGVELTDAERADQALYYCQECGEAIEDMHKPLMLRKGRWIDVARRIGQNQIPRKIAFWLNTLYSPFVTWTDIAREWLGSQEDKFELRNFYNSWLAEAWVDTDVETDADMVMSRQSDEPVLVVPEWAELLTGGVDVQESCVYWTIRAWGPYLTSQNIAHGQALSLESIEPIMNQSYQKENGEVFLVNLCCVDSGDRTDDVYEFCLNNNEWAIPVKGSSTQMLTHFKISTINKTDSKAYGQRLVIVDTEKYKDAIASRMRRENGTGSWMVYNGCDLDYAEQVTAERKATEIRGGKEVSKWEPKKSHGDNHYLDTEVYCFVAADLCNVRGLHLNVSEPAKKESESEQPDNNWLGVTDNWLKGQ